MGATVESKVLAELTVQRLRGEIGAIKERASTLQAEPLDKIIPPPFYEFVLSVVGLLAVAAGLILRNSCGGVGLAGVALLGVYLLARTTRRRRARRIQADRLRQWDDEAMELQHELEENFRVIQS